MAYQIGDPIRVKPGTPCPDADLDIGGWQGRVVDLTYAQDEEEPTIGLAWDSVALRALPEWYIKHSESEGLDWSQMYLGLDEIEPARARDKPRDVERAREEIAARFGWLGIGPEGERIQAVVNSARSTRDWDVMKAWRKYLSQNLRFPFAAVIDEYQERGPLQAGQRLTVQEIIDVDDLYGVIVSCRRGCERFDFPLADLAAVDKGSPNAQVVEDYRTWFANR
jgi:hypothetical protein